jgi:hypothetical protein
VASWMLSDAWLAASRVLIRRDANADSFENITSSFCAACDRGGIARLRPDYRRRYCRIRWSISSLGTTRRESESRCGA